MTEATGELSSAMLHNSVNVMTRQREEQGVMEYPLFTHTELDRNPRAVELPADPQALHPRANRHRVHDVRRRPHHGLVPGCSCARAAEALFYTGDVNFEAQTIMREADFPREKVDALIVETTRGDYARPEGFFPARREGTPRGADPRDVSSGEAR